MSVTRMEDFQRKRTERYGGAGSQGSLPLYGGGGPTGMEPTPNWKDYIDAKDSALESRMSHQVGQMASEKTVRNNTWGAAAAVLGVLLAVLAFGGDRFDGGMNASVLLKEQAANQEKIDQDQDARLGVIDSKLDILIRQTAEN